MVAMIASSFQLISQSEGPLSAQSLFERRSPNQVDQYRAYAARRKGDLLTVIITESTDVENRDERTLDKTGNSNVSATGSYSLGGGLGSAVGNAGFDQNSTSRRGFTGDSEFRSERQFLDRFTVSVIDELPNGNLIIAGERKILIQGDSQTLKLSGIVRQVDLLPDNTISSRLVSRLSIELTGKGPEQKFTKQGFFGKKMNRWWPF